MTIGHVTKVGEFWGTLLLSLAVQLRTLRSRFSFLEVSHVLCETADRGIATWLRLCFATKELVHVSIL